MDNYGMIHADEIQVAYRKEDIKTIEDRLMQLLMLAERSGDELVGWVTLKWFQEYISLLPFEPDKGAGSRAVKSGCNLQNRTRYLEFVIPFKENLDAHRFYLACGDLTHMLYSGCIRFAGIRDVILQILTTHESLQIQRIGREENAKKMVEFLQKGKE